MGDKASLELLLRRLLGLWSRMPRNGTNGGVDYLKYDWQPNDVSSTSAMKDALRATGRDIILSLSNAAEFDQTAEWARLAHAWRTTHDITDTWASMSGIGFTQDRWAPHASPGHWNDPDMLVVGRVGWGNPKPTRLSGDEQYTHISLWCLLSAPLLIGCDLEQLDEFTVSLLTNDEVLEINQDALGKQATAVARGLDWVGVCQTAGGRLVCCWPLQPCLCPATDHRALVRPQAGRTRSACVIFGASRSLELSRRGIEHKSPRTASCLCDSIPCGERHQPHQPAMLILRLFIAFPFASSKTRRPIARHNFGPDVFMNRFLAVIGQLIVLAAPLALGFELAGHDGRSFLARFFDSGIFRHPG